MIVQVKGKINYPITLDPSVWIFDDRKIMLEDAFTGENKEKEEEDAIKKAAELFNQEIYSQKSIKPPVNKSLSREEQKKALVHSFVMPIKDFIETAEIRPDAKQVVLKTDGDDIGISIEQLTSAYFLFAIDGKPVRDSGPVHLFFGDGSNAQDPIKGIKEIILV